MYRKGGEGKKTTEIATLDILWHISDLDLIIQSWMPKCMQ